MAVYYMTLSNSLGMLDASQDTLLNTSKRIVEAYGNALYGLDLLALAAVNRSLHLIPAFRYCIETRNMFAAAPLLRLHLDSSLRLSAAWIVKEPHDFALRVLRGEHVRKMKDAQGKLMTDAYLVKLHKEKYPWVERVYERCSDFVHLSGVHISGILRKGNEEGSFRIQVGHDAAWLVEDKFTEGVEGFNAATRLLLEFLEGWQFTKDNPEAVKQLRNSKNKG